MLYPPDIIRIQSDQAPVSLRTFIVDNRAIKVVLDNVGGVQVKVPRSRTCKLCDTLLLSRTS
jgi:hypothetical protein